LPGDAYALTDLCGAQPLLIERGDGFFQARVPEASRKLEPLAGAPGRVGAGAAQFLQRAIGTDAEAFRNIAVIQLARSVPG
jgi:hypothetical protein